MARQRYSRPVAFSPPMDRAERIQTWQMTPVPLHRTIGRSDNFAIVFRPGGNLLWDLEGMPDERRAPSMV